MNLYLDNSNLPTLDPNIAAQVKTDRENGVDVKQVVRGYYPDQHMHLANHGLPDDALLNMYDVFQKATDVETKTVHYRHNPQIDKARYHLDWLDWGMAQARRFGTTYGRNVIDIDLFPGNPGGTTSMLHYVDRNDNTAVTDIWDWRGFKSATRYYQTTGNVSNIIFYTPTGDIAARASFMWQHLEGKPNTEWPLVQTSLEVLDYDGEHLWFESEMHAWEYFVQHEQQKRNAALR
ncbi:glycosyl transferase [Weissella confusa]|uniref:glycosyl transferase n=1 Tax=Weissella confusa TaxID=1583 RepID=UPI000E4F7A32|nr:glycosyl transferase [Weissella confusa]MBJ7682203.1 glycosyl transferase [Weissella confusa]MBJ7684390.1 glycosyl transferase [Weissella confusa]MBJ7703018.1 glycosyl transferase [Weissella confusa]RGX46779.1 glycosyl transferase [Weissella confusa]